MTHATRTLQSYDLSGEGINSGSHTYFFDPTRTWRASRMSDQLNVGATSETTQTWKTIGLHTIHAPINSNKANMKGWLWRPNDIRGPCWPKTSWHLSYRWGKTPKKPHLFRPGIEPGHIAWQACMLPPVPQRWTFLSLRWKTCLRKKCTLGGACVCSERSALGHNTLLMMLMISGTQFGDSQRTIQRTH